MGKKRTEKLQRAREGALTAARAEAAIVPAAAPVALLVVLLLVVGGYAASAVKRNRDYQTTISLWRSIVRSAPEKRRAHENLGQALSTEGSIKGDTRLYEEALKEFKTVLALPEDGSVPMRDVYREIGVVYFRLGLIDESINAWREGLRHAAYDPGLLNNLSIALMRQNRFDEALAYAKTAKEGNPTMPEPANTLGEIFMARGEYAKAAEQFLWFIQLRPEDPRGYWNAALAMERAGQLQRSYEYVTQYLAREGDPARRSMAMSLVSSLKARGGQVTGHK